MQSSAQSGRTTAFDRGDATRLFCAFSIIAEELAQVRLLIERELSDCSEPVRGLAAYVSSSRGKMVRPGLVLLSGLACGKVTEKHIRAAAIVEMIHNATLLHDDVVDEGESRRGVPTLNSMQGNESAVLLGDFLLSRVFGMCMGLGRREAGEIASFAARTCEGELRQIAQRGNSRLSETEYIEIVAEKTAAMFSGACMLGSMLAGGGKPQVRMLADYGRKTGIAFQITDDLLDLTGDQDKTGKTVGNDLDKNKLTLPVIHFLQVADEADKSGARGLLCCDGKKPESQGKAALVEKLKRYGSLTYAQRCAEGLAEEAIEAIAKLKNGEAKRALIETARFVVRRTA
jgi:octaprenyl-diphosphate synthase